MDSRVKPENDIIKQSYIIKGTGTKSEEDGLAYYRGGWSGGCSGQ